MKKLTLIAAALSVAGTGFLLSTVPANGANVETYTAIADPNLASNAQDQNAVVSTLWSCSFNGTGGVDDGSYVDSGNNAWALWSNDQQATATAAISGGALAVGQTVSFDFLNGYVNGQVGFDLGNGSQNGLAVWYPSSGGGYHYFDNAGVLSTGEAYQNNTFIAFDFTLTSANTYSASFGGNNWSGTLGNSVTSISQIDFYNNADYSGGGGENNVELSNLAISAAPVPEPSTVAMLLSSFGFGSFYLIRRRRS